MRPRPQRYAVTDTTSNINRLPNEALQINTRTHTHAPTHLRTFTLAFKSTWTGIQMFFKISLLFECQNGIDDYVEIKVDMVRCFKQNSSTSSLVLWHLKPTSEMMKGIWGLLVCFWVTGQPLDRNMRSSTARSLAEPNSSSDSSSSSSDDEIREHWRHHVCCLSQTYWLSLVLFSFYFWL